MQLSKMKQQLNKAIVAVIAVSLLSILIGIISFIIRDDDKNTARKIDVCAYDEVAGDFLYQGKRKVVCHSKDGTFSVKDF